MAAKAVDLFGHLAPKVYLSTASADGQVKLDNLVAFEQDLHLPLAIRKHRRINAGTRKEPFVKLEKLNPDFTTEKSQSAQFTGHAGTSKLAEIMKKKKKKKKQKRSRPEEVEDYVAPSSKKKKILLAQDGNNDCYCWVCHKEGKVMLCGACPRVYHNSCLKDATISEGQIWFCPECEQIVKAEDLDSQSKTLASLNEDQLAKLLQCALHRMKHAGAAPFLKPMDTQLHAKYMNYIYCPMDLSKVEKNVKDRVYGSPIAFLADVKWILHNSVIYNGSGSKLTRNAEFIIKIAQHEMNEIDLCPDCYLYSYQKRDHWFCEPCREPHTLIWAKLKGFPYWPAKALKEENGQVDVRFFGQHDRAWVPLSSCYMISKEMPFPPNKKTSGLNLAAKEIEIHMERLRKKKFNCHYFPFRTPMDPHLATMTHNTLQPPVGGKYTIGSGKSQFEQQASKQKFGGNRRKKKRRPNVGAVELKEISIVGYEEDTEVGMGDVSITQEALGVQKDQEVRKMLKTNESEVDKSGEKEGEGVDTFLQTSAGDKNLSQKLIQSQEKTGVGQERSGDGSCDTHSVLNLRETGSKSEGSKIFGDKPLEDNKERSKVDVGTDIQDAQTDEKGSAVFEDSSEESSRSPSPSRKSVSVPSTRSLTPHKVYSSSGKTLVFSPAIDAQIEAEKKIQESFVEKTEILKSGAAAVITKQMEINKTGTLDNGTTGIMIESAQKGNVDSGVKYVETHTDENMETSVDDSVKDTKEGKDSLQNLPDSISLAQKPDLTEREEAETLEGVAPPSKVISETFRKDIFSAKLNQTMKSCKKFLGLGSDVKGFTMTADEESEVEIEKEGLGSGEDNSQGEDDEKMDYDSDQQERVESTLSLSKSVTDESLSGRDDSFLSCGMGFTDGEEEKVTEEDAEKEKGGDSDDDMDSGADHESDGGDREEDGGADHESDADDNDGDEDADNEEDDDDDDDNDDNDKVVGHDKENWNDSGFTNQAQTFSPILTIKMPFGSKIRKKSEEKVNDTKEKVEEEMDFEDNKEKLINDLKEGKEAEIKEEEEMSEEYDFGEDLVIDEGETLEGKKGETVEGKKEETLEGKKEETLEGKKEETDDDGKKVKEDVEKMEDDENTNVEKIVESKLNQEASEIDVERQEGVTPEVGKLMIPEEKITSENGEDITKTMKMEEGESVMAEQKDKVPQEEQKKESLIVSETEDASLKADIGDQKLDAATEDLPDLQKISEKILGGVSESFDSLEVQNDSKAETVDFKEVDTKDSEIKMSLQEREDLKLRAATKEKELKVLKKRFEKQANIHETQLEEVKKIYNLTIAEVIQVYQSIMDERVKQVQKDFDTAVLKTKLKQWCAFCQKEAVFFCCWNTSYCDNKCQLKHWVIHQKTCQQVTSLKTSGITTIVGRPPSATAVANQRRDSTYVTPSVQSGPTMQPSTTIIQNNQASRIQFSQGNPVSSSVINGGRPFAISVGPQGIIPAQQQMAGPTHGQNTVQPLVHTTGLSVQSRMPVANQIAASSPMNIPLQAASIMGNGGQIQPVMNQIAIHTIHPIQQNSVNPVSIPPPVNPAPVHNLIVPVQGVGLPAGQQGGNHGQDVPPIPVSIYHASPSEQVSLGSAASDQLRMLSAHQIQIAPGVNVPAISAAAAQMGQSPQLTTQTSKSPAVIPPSQELLSYIQAPPRMAVPSLSSTQPTQSISQPQNDQVPHGIIQHGIPQSVTMLPQAPSLQPGGVLLQPGHPLQSGPILPHVLQHSSVNTQASMAQLVSQQYPVMTGYHNSLQPNSVPPVHPNGSQNQFQLR